MLTQQPHRPFCANCKIQLAKPNGISKHGFKKWHKYCVECSKAVYDPTHGYILHKKTICESCGFVPIDMCQLDIVYKDNNKKNKKEDNILTLCANCNRLHQKQVRQHKKSILDITVDSDVTI